MKKKSKLLFSGFIGLLLSCTIISCTTDSLEKDGNTSNNTRAESLNLKYRGAYEGVLAVKLKHSIGDNIKIKQSASGLVTCDYAPLNASLAAIGAKNMKRIFPYCGKYEERSVREGLNLWYYVTFDKTKPLSEAESNLLTLKELDIVEPCYKIESYAGTRSKYLPASTAIASELKCPFDDPLENKQWHYNNTGEKPRFVKGADINLYKAWTIERGKPNVIVDVVDAGVDCDHVDLKENVWVNEAEANGTPGVDDDDNGYIDDIHGFDFCKGVGKITPDNHATHVAGIIAARNNNATGVCGIAGGDGTPGSGVRIMSSQIFHDEFDQPNHAAAIKYGADNGAVISQNSWGFVKSVGITETPQYIKDAIDYFIKYAGCDNNGNQLPNSPMKGGVVIFAAGNDGITYPAPPGSYGPVLDVSAFGPDFKVTAYSNRGKWVSLCAPGGDVGFGGEQDKDGEVFSLYQLNGYGYMSGTSMACPHVSGVAALVVSKYGRTGFTNNDLKRRLMTALRPYDIDKINPEYAGTCGRGYIDAYRALADNSNNVPPEKLGEIKTIVGYDTLSIAWKAVDDKNDEVVDHYNLYYIPNNKLTPADIGKANKIEIKSVFVKPGDNMKYVLRKLNLNTRYFLGLEAEDRWGAKTDIKFFDVKTKENHPPILKPVGDINVKVTGNEVKTIKILVDDPDKDQKWTYKLSGDTEGVEKKIVKDTIMLMIRAVNPVSDYNLKLEVSDPFGGKAEILLKYAVYENHNPEFTKEMPNIFIPFGGTVKSIDLTKYTTDPDGQKLTYKVSSNDKSIALVNINGNKMEITPVNLGVAYASITAEDTQLASVSTSFRINVCKADLVYLVYPIPVKNILNIKLSDEVAGSVNVEIFTFSGRKIINENITSIPEEKLLKIDVKKLTSGTYLLKVKANGKEYKQIFGKE